MPKGVIFSTITVKSNNKAAKLPVKGYLAFQVVNKGDSSVFIDTHDEIESGASQCYGEMTDRVYCEDLDIRFAATGDTEYILLRRWFPVEDECCPPTP